MPTAIITGASRGLGLELARALAERGWDLVVDARGAAALDAAARRLRAAGARSVTAIAGDVADAAHRSQLAAAARGQVDLLVNNASVLGPSPLRPLGQLDAATLTAIYAVNVVAPVELTRLVLGDARACHGVIVNVTSDASVEAYPGWGGYGSSKAALDHASAVQAAEVPSVPVYAVDPGDMRTDLHQLAFPGEDISDRPEPSTVVPAFLRLLDRRPPSGRYRAEQLVDVAAPA